MQVVDNKALLVNTKYPDRIVNAIAKSKVIKKDNEFTKVLVNWGFEEAKALKELQSGKTTMLNRIAKLVGQSVEIKPGAGRTRQVIIKK